MNEPKRRTSSRRIRFQELASELTERLERLQTPAALEVAKLGRELVARFDAWGEREPEGEERVRVISEMTEFNRRALDLLARGG